MNKHIFPRLNNIIHFHLLATPSLCIYDSFSTLLHIHGSISHNKTVFTIVAKELNSEAAGNQ